ncbi:putative nuclease HARBI1 [Merluccius polli]|uniref:Nuclease HARBI1 n=1 Tax=Merluccius polli TaxID=89951 RepID=A0AA47NM98_MERPO|nr:putative nuclease HARBI1 [Merluccius polli]
MIVLSPQCSCQQPVISWGLKGLENSWYFQISPSINPQKTFLIKDAFTSDKLSLVDQSCPVDKVQKRAASSFDRHNSHLIIPTESLLRSTRGSSSPPHPARSKQDKEAMKLLEAKTVRVKIDGTEHYAIPLLRIHDGPNLQAPKESLVQTYTKEIDKLVQAGYVVKLTTEQISNSLESWYIPHPIVEHNGNGNGKHRKTQHISYQGQALNDQLLPGPILGPSLLGMLLRLQEHKVAISGNIKSMFHQIRLLSEDRPLLKFLWCDLKREDPPEVYEWQVLPFGTTCSPCCAIYAVQRHAQAYQEHSKNVAATVLQSFYAKELVVKLRDVLSTGGFDIRQRASNIQSVVDHLPPEAQADNIESWLSHDRIYPTGGILRLSWHFSSDTLRNKYSSGDGYQTAHRCSISRQLSFPDNYLFERYRFTSQSIIYIHNLIRPYICNITNCSHALTSQQILCVALRFFANGSFLYNVGDAEHLSKATVCRAVRKVCLAMKRLLPMFVVFPGQYINLSEPSRRSWRSQNHPPTALDEKKANFIMHGWSGKKTSLTLPTSSTHDHMSSTSLVL